MKHLKLILITLTSLSLAACGGSNVPTSTSGIVTSAQASSTTMVTNLNTLVGNLGTNLTNPSSVAGGSGVTASTVLPFAADPLASCTKITPTTLIDDDADDISKEKNYEFNCQNIDTGDGFPFTKTGTVEIRDLDDTKKLVDGGGYSYTFDLELSSTDAFFASWEGFYRFEEVGSTQLYTSQFTSTFRETHSGQDIEGGWSSNFTHSMTPLDPADFYKGGTAITDGYYRLIVKGDDGQGNILDWDFTFKITSDLSYERTSINNCKFFYRDGFLEFQDAANNTMRFEYFCDRYTYSVNGTLVLTQN